MVKPGHPKAVSVTSPEITILTDHPSRATEESPDLLGLESRLAIIFDILRHKQTHCPITVAVYGDWGTGKTSAMRWLETKLKEWNNVDKSKRNGHPKVYPVWFDPWKYHTREEVWRGIISEVILAFFLVEKLDTENFKIRLTEAAKKFSGFLGRGFLHALSNMQVELGTSEGGKLTVSGEMFSEIYNEYDKSAHPEKAYLNQFENTLHGWVRNYLQKDARMVLFIDDLDRCLPEVTLEMLEAIKLYLNIEQLVFVVGLDRTVVDGVVSKHYDEHGLGEQKAHDYLSKIFQVEVQVTPSEEQIKGFLQKQVNGLNENSGGFWNKMLDGTEHKRVLEEGIRHEARHNPREIKRLLNNALMRGHTATQLCGESDKKLRFAQGIQLLLLDRIFRRSFSKAPHLLVEKASLLWLCDLSEFRGKYPDYYPLTEPVKSEDSTELRGTINPGQTDGETLKKAFDVLRDNSPFDDEGKPISLNVLSKTHFWDLLSIPFSVEVAQNIGVPEPSNPQKPVAMASTDDPLAQMPAVLRDWLAATLNKPVTELTATDLASLKVFSLATSDVSDTDLQYLAKLSSLQEIDLSYTTLVTDKGLLHLSSLINLKTLKLSNTNVTDKGLAHIAKLINLYKLELAHNNNVTDKGLAHIVKLTNLKILNLYDTKVTDKGIGYIVKLTNLQELKLGYNTEVSDRGLPQLTELSNLIILDLSDTKVTDKGLPHIAKLKNLQELDLARNKEVTDNGLSQLIILSNLQKLNLARTKVTDSGIAHIVKLTNLRRLYLTGANVTEVGIKNIAKLTSLKILDLADTKLTDEHLALLTKLTSLQRLYISRNKKVTDDGLAQLINFNSLRILDLAHTNVTDKGLEYLVNISNLKELNLRNTEVTDNGLTQLEKFPALEKLFLSSDTKITRKGITVLENKLKHKLVFIR